LKEKYLCVSCNRTFAVGDAVDGFGQGYRKGFLCPFCNANLRDAGESDDVLNLRFGIIYFLSMIIVFLVDRAEVFQVRITANAQICVFQTKVATDSRRSLPPIPRESCH